MFLSKPTSSVSRFSLLHAATGRTVVEFPAAVERGADSGPNDSPLAVLQAPPATSQPRVLGLHHGGPHTLKPVWLCQLLLCTSYTQTGYFKAEHWFARGSEVQVFRDSLPSWFSLTRADAPPRLPSRGARLPPRPLGALRVHCRHQKWGWPFFYDPETHTASFQLRCLSHSSPRFKGRGHGLHLSMDSMSQGDAIFRWPQLVTIPLRFQRKHARFHNMFFDLRIQSYWIFRKLFRQMNSSTIISRPRIVQKL